MNITTKAIMTLLLTFGLITTALAKDSFYSVDYRVKLEPEKDQAQVSISLKHRSDIKKIQFRTDPQRYQNFKTTSPLEVQNDRVIWQPKNRKAILKYTVKLSHQRSTGSYDAYVTKDWAIFRGDDLIPPARVSARKNAKAITKLHFKLPQGWTSVDSGWLHEDKKKRSFIIDNPERLFDRPTGWIIAGKVGNRREQLGRTEVSVAAPVGSSFQRMEAMAFLTMLWPHIEQAFGKTPSKILLVGADDPMWRGGLSSPNSLFMHADRPLVSGNATSTLLHELTHVITRIRGKEKDDWIAEGLAEFYSIELLYRAGALTEERYAKVYQWLEEWSKQAGPLRGSASKGPTTAKAVLLLQELDKEIREKSNGEHNMDDVTQALMALRKVSLKDLCTNSEILIGDKSKILSSLN